MSERRARARELPDIQLGLMRCRLRVVHSHSRIAAMRQREMVQEVSSLLDVSVLTTASKQGKGGKKAAGKPKSSGPSISSTKLKAAAQTALRQARAKLARKKKANTRRGMQRLRTLSIPSLANAVRALQGLHTNNDPVASPDRDRPDRTPAHYSVPAASIAAKVSEQSIVKELNMHPRK